MNPSSHLGAFLSLNGLENSIPQEWLDLYNRFSVITPFQESIRPSLPLGELKS